MPKSMSCWPGKRCKNAYMPQTKYPGYNRVMFDISDEQFSALITEVMDELPQDHMEAVRNLSLIHI